MKLNWFSPLPPAKTDIAHYTKRLLPALSSIAEVTLWTDQRTWDRALEKIAHVHSYDLHQMSWVQLNRADMTCYQIGNNPKFHGAIWQIARQHAGIIVLHDFRLHHFFDGLYRVQYRDRSSYLAVMERYYGPQGRIDASYCYQNNARNIDDMATRYPLTELALENALGVIVHTESSFDSLKANQRWPLAYAPLPFPTGQCAKDKTDRDRGGTPYRLIVFGYLGRNRRLHSILKALAQIEGSEKFHLDVFGSILDDEKGIRAEINDLQLKQRVTLHGFTSEAQLDAALAKSDLAINLRFPTMGEASGSQLRIWAHELPSLVSQVGWYGSLPPETVAFVRTDENEIADIKHHLQTFLANPESFAALGKRGREKLDTDHSCEAYAATVLAIASEAQSFRPQAASMGMATRAARQASEWFGPQVAETLFGRIANELLVLGKR